MAESIASLLGTRLPLIQAPMAGVQLHELAAAVCNAGGLGSLPAAMLTAEKLAEEMTALQQRTARPFNVNFFCHTPPAADAAAEARWRDTLRCYGQELGIDVDTAAPGAGRLPFSAALVDLIEPFAPPVVSFHFGLPAPELLARVRRWGAKVLSSATSAAEALWLQERGVDAVIAQGLEAGGHRGHFLTADLDVATQIGTFALLPQVVAAVRVPVIAAGGIASPEGVRAALALGAAGVQVGTAFLLCPEATTSPLHRAALAGAGARETALTNVFTGRPARGIVNRLMREIGPLSQAAPAFPLATAALAPLRAAAEARGSSDFSPLWAGQNVSGCHDWPAAEVVRWLCPD